MRRRNRDSGNRTPAPLDVPLLEWRRTGAYFDAARGWMFNDQSKGS
jgi:hypothetical protein